MACTPIRWHRLVRPSGNLVMVPMDHGVSNGPLSGLQDPRTVLEAVVGHGASCVTVHKGLVRHVAPFTDRIGCLLHLSASSDAAPDPDDKRLVATVEEALRLGCDGVSIHINVGATTEARMVQDAGAVATACQEWGVPLVTMAYPRGPGVDDPFRPDLVAHAARLAAELGADAVKVPYTGDPESFRRVTEGATVPVIVAGGPRRDDFNDLLTALRGAKEAGAAGVSIGRNVFQSDDPGAAMAAIAKIFP